MNNITSTAQTADTGTNLRNFMANRGAIIIKETKPIGTVTGDYGVSLEVETIVLQVIRGVKKDTAFGALLTVKKSDGTEEKVNLDFDELAELINALSVIRHTADEIGLTQRDYTEVFYATKENAKFGFFQANGSQTGFIDIGYRGNLFQPVNANVNIEHLLRNAVAHLRSKGAEIVNE